MEPKADQLGNFVNGGKVLGGEEVSSVAEITALAVHLKGVGEPAGLGAFTPVGASPAEDLAGEALSGVSNTEGTVDKDFEREAGRVGGGGEFGQFPQGKLPGKNSEVEALATGERDSLRGSEGHLGGGVELDLRADGLGKADEAEILNNEGIHGGGGSEAEESLRLQQLRGKDKDVHGEVTPASAGMEEVHDLREVPLREVLRPEPGVEGRQAEINGIRSSRHRRLETVPVARRGEQFRFSCFHPTVLAQGAPLGLASKNL